MGLIDGGVSESRRGLFKVAGQMGLLSQVKWGDNWNSDPGMLDLFYLTPEQIEAARKLSVTGQNDAEIALWKTSDDPTLVPANRNLKKVKDLLPLSGNWLYQATSAIITPGNAPFTPELIWELKRPKELFTGTGSVRIIEEEDRMEGCMRLGLNYASATSALVLANTFVRMARGALLYQQMIDNLPRAAKTLADKIAALNQQLEDETKTAQFLADSYEAEAQAGLMEGVLVGSPLTACSIPQWRRVQQYVKFGATNNSDWANYLSSGLNNL
jgi:hypothetical protein